MQGINWRLGIYLVPVVIVISLGAFIIRRRKLTNRGANMDKSAWFLVLLLIVAILSMISFIAFIFLRGFAG